MSTLPGRARAVVIGAGIVGNSLVHHLARLGWSDLVLLDKGPLPNPYWEPALRDLTGQDTPVQEFLEAAPAVGELLADIVRFLEARVGEFERLNRGYLTVAVGCTGGRHRSVYLVDRLARHFAARHPQVLARHTTLHAPG